MSNTFRLWLLLYAASFIGHIGAHFLPWRDGLAGWERALGTWFLVAIIFALLCGLAPWRDRKAEDRRP